MNKYSSDEDIHSWLSLVTQHGLFVSDPVLNTAFSKGVERVPDESFRAFKREFDLYSLYSEKDDVAKFTKWINFILEDFLGFSRSSWCKHPNIQDDVKHYLFEYDQWLAPDRVLLSNDGKPLLLVKIVKNGKSLEKPEKEKGKWKASPYFKLTTLCLEKNIPLALLTNGDEFRLIHVKPTTGTSYFEWKARDCYEEKSLLDSFYTFLHKDRFFGDEQKRLLHLIDESQKRQLDVTDQLGGQMHHALEIFVRAIGNLKQSDLQDLFSKATGEYIYEMSLTFMMRLVFLLYAEENGLLPHGNFVYENNYGVSHLVYQIQSRIKDEQYMSKKDAWPRILALFRLIYSGCGHPDVKSIPYDSELFDPGRFPELEHPSLVLDNKTIWNFLHNLCYAETRIGREKVKQKVSYHTIDVEQIGSVYESLIGFSVERASEKMVVFSGKENTIRPVSEFINLDDDAIVDYLKSVTGRAEDSIRNILENNEESIEGLAGFERFIAEEGIIEKGQLYISRAGSIRKSSGTYYTPKEITRFLVQEALEPLVYEETEEGRKIKSPREILDLNVCDPAMGSGAFLVQAIRYLSERLVESWIKINSATDENITLPYGDISHGADNEELLPSDEMESLQRAKLYVAQNCIYGVDKNHMAVELAKVSIWLTTMCKDRPLTFLDHRLKCGDSLIGTDFEHISKIPDDPLWKEDKKYNQAAAKSKTLTGINFEEFIKDILILRENLRSPELTIDDIKRKSKQYKQAHTEDKPITRLKEVFDLWTSVWFWPYDEKNKNYSKITKNKTLKTTLFSIDGGNNWVNYNSNSKNIISEELDKVVDVITPPHTGKYREIALSILDLKDDFNNKYPIKDYIKIIKETSSKHQFFHWELEFPEVFLNDVGELKENPGFNAVVGNPPWDMVRENADEFFSQYDPDFRRLNSNGKKQRIKEITQSSSQILEKWENYKKSYTEWIYFFTNNYKHQGKGHINSFKLFMEVAFRLTKNNGFYSVIVPSGIYTDDGCSDLRKLFLKQTEIKNLICFENRMKIFPIHSSYKFVLLSVLKGKNKKIFRAAFMKHDVKILEKIEDNTLLLDEKYIEKFSPDTLSIMEFKNQNEIDLFSKLYGAHPLIGQYKINSDKINFHRELNLTDDSHLLNTKAVGKIVYEGKMINHYYNKFSNERYWISNFPDDKKYQDYKFDSENYRVGYRAVASSTNETTLISTIIPKGASSVYSLHTIYLREDEIPLTFQLFICSLFNSFILNYILRSKVSANISMFYIYQLPIPEYSKNLWYYKQITARAARLICTSNEYEELWKEVYSNFWVNLSINKEGTSLLENWSDLRDNWIKPCGVYGWAEDKRDTGDRAQLRAEIDALVAHLYGITKEEFSYILDTFPVLKKNEETTFGEFKSKRKCLEDYERLKPIIEEERKKYPEQFEINNYEEE